MAGLRELSGVFGVLVIAEPLIFSVTTSQLLSGLVSCPDGKEVPSAA